MPSFAFIIYNDESTFADPAVWPALERAHSEFNAAVIQAGAKVKAVFVLAPSSAARTVKPGLIVSDGPFIDGKEAVGGTYVIEVADEAQALKLAQLCPSSGGAIEVRQLLEY